MKRLILILIALSVSGWGGVQLGGGVEAAAPAGGVAWTDTFTRTNNTDITANCTTPAEGPNDVCDWDEVSGGVEISTNTLISTGAVVFQVSSGLGTDTLAHHSAATFTTGATVGNAGPLVRATGGSGTADCFYTFRYNDTSNFSLRACHSGTSCADIAAVTNTEMGTAMASGDAIGLSVSADTGNGIDFTLYKWDAADAPDDFASWSSATTIWTICTSGCDEDFASPDVTPSSALSTAGCTADADGATNKRVGLYSGYEIDTAMDKWVGGDN